MNMQTILDYLTQLSASNNREWHYAHKAQYQAASAQFEEPIQHRIFRIGEFDGSVLGRTSRKLTFKLARYTSLGHDKSPCNPAFRAHIPAVEKLPVPAGCYIMLKPGGQSFLGGGLFADMFRDAARIIRHYIPEHGSKWEKTIMHYPGFSRRALP